MSWLPPRRRDGRPAPTSPRTIVDKVWDDHLAQPPIDGEPDQLVVDRILVHEHQVGLLADGGVDRNGSRVSDPRRVVACADQQSPTTPSTGGPRSGAQHQSAFDRLERVSSALGLPVFGPGDPRNGVVNVVAAEQGMVSPGDLIVGADAHVATNGALGAIALVVADAEVPDVVRTGLIERQRPAVVRASVVGSLGPGAAPKDVALWLLGRLGPDLARDKVLELTGSGVASMSVEGRMTLCNVLVGSGALTVVVAPDRSVEEYLDGRPFAPRHQAWIDATARWRRLATEPGSELDADVVAIGAIDPHATWGTAPDQVAPLDGVVPHPHQTDPRRRERDEQALHEQGLTPGQALAEIGVDQVFIGSCANARIDDLRAAAEVLDGQRVQVPTWVVPGSWPVRRQAEAEGLHRIFLDAGVEWREPGCSLCIGSNGDAVRPGTRLASTANRTARGGVGPGARVHLLGPASAAASALTGRLSSPRTVA